MCWLLFVINMNLIFSDDCLLDTKTNKNWMQIWINESTGALHFCTNNNFKWIEVVKFKLCVVFTGTTTCFTTCCWELQRRTGRSLSCSPLKTTSTSSRYSTIQLSHPVLLFTFLSIWGKRQRILTFNLMQYHPALFSSESNALSTMHDNLLCLQCDPYANTSFHCVLTLCSWRLSSFWISYCLHSQLTAHMCPAC